MGRRRDESRWLSIGERGRRIMHAGTWSLVAKGSAAAHLFLSVPFVLAALGPERFGAWATLAALVTFAGFLDFGVGNGAMNLVAAAHGRGANTEIVTILHEARRILMQVAIGLLAMIASVGFIVPWHSLLGMPAEMANECRAATLVLLVSVAFSVPLNLANRIQLGLGRGDRTFRWQAIGQWLALCAVIVLSKLHASLPLLTAATVATPLIATAINSWQLWRQLDMRSAPVAAGDDREAVGKAIRIDGLAFFGLQLSAALAFSADLPLISALSSAGEAGQYAIAQRLFSTIPLTLSLVWAPLWPIYRHALTAGDDAWVARTFRRSIVAAVLFASLAGAGLFFGFAPITSLWIRDALPATSLLLAGMAIWSVVEAAGTALATLLNAASVLRYQLATSCAFATLCVIGKALVVANGHIDWLPWITASTYLAVNIVGIVFFCPAILSVAFRRSS